MRAKLVREILGIVNERGITRASLMRRAGLSFAECHALYQGKVDLLPKERLQEIILLLN